MGKPNIDRGIYAHLTEETATLLKSEQRPTNKDVAKTLIQRHSLDASSTNPIEKFVGVVARRLRDEEQYKAAPITTNKKIAQMDWKEILEPMKQLQALARAASGSQDRANWEIDTDEEICVLVLGDTQLGSYATNYESFIRITEDIINIPNLYVILVGDLLQMAIKLRGVKEVSDMLIDPQTQQYFLESWLLAIRHKVIASTWDNHSVMRQEDQAGYSAYAELFKRHTIYFGGIGHLDMRVGEVWYKWAVSHFFRGKSLLNKGHSLMRYMRHEGQDRDIAAQGDFHDPFVGQYWEGGKMRTAIVCGTIQTDSGYGKRFFSLTTCDNMPCVVLNPKEKLITPYWSVKNWLIQKQYRLIAEGQM
jgi:hypothetical protein